MRVWRVRVRIVSMWVMCMGRVRVLVKTYCGIAATPELPAVAAAAVTEPSSVLLVRTHGAQVVF